MSKNIQALLKHLNLENAEELVTALLADTDNQEVIDKILKGAQGYAKPFVETELKSAWDSERGSLKGKYFKDAARKVNSKFKNVLTNREMDDILDDPKNEGKTFDAVLDVVAERALSKSTGTEAEKDKMLDAANAKISELEEKFTTREQEWKSKYEQDISGFKLNSILKTKLVKVLTGKTSIPEAEAAELLEPMIRKAAHLKPKGDDDLELYHPEKNDEPLKKNETTLYKFDGLVDDLVTKFNLAKKSNGTTTGAAQQQTKPTTETTNPSVQSAEGLAAVLQSANAG